MTDNDLQIARDVGELRADMRTVKHDLAGISAKFDTVFAEIRQITNKQARGIGFFAGMAFLLTTFGGGLLVIGKLLFGGHSG